VAAVPSGLSLTTIVSTLTLRLLVPSTTPPTFLTYCDRFDGTSDMNAATQRIRRPSLGNDSVNNA
jgi:hypothetical protein